MEELQSKQEQIKFIKEVNKQNVENSKGIKLGQILESAQDLKKKK